MVAIITINYNLHQETIPCVESILASHYQDFIIYLVDNGSKHDDYNEILKFFEKNLKVKILRIENNCGYVGGVNHGIIKAKEINPDYYMIMNNDTIIDKEAVGHLVDAANRYSNNAIVSGKVYYFDNPDILQHTGEIITDARYIKTKTPGKNERDIGQFDYDIERDVLDDVFWLIPSKIVNDVGLYCNYFFLYAEQGDYALRTRQKGYKLIFTPKAKIWHKVSMTSGGGNTVALPISYWRGQGLFIFQYRNVKVNYFIVLMVNCFISFTLKALLKKGYARKSAYAFLRGYFWGFCWMFNKRPNDGRNPYLNFF